MGPELKSGVHKPCSHAFVFLFGVLLIGLWIFTRDVIASGFIAAAFGWYIVTRIEDYFLAVTLSTILGFVFYVMNRV